MKRILITGANSYIGVYFENYMKKYSEEFLIDTVDMMDDLWRSKDFSKYDVVFHVAGIAHSDPKEDQKDLYYRVNTDLAIETAKRAKDSGVQQFIFMSSIIVFGKGNRCITKGTEPKPENFYGDSKLKADIGIQALNNESFKVVSIRPPMIYGKGSKGNYPRLAALAKKTPVFPSIENKRSMLHIDNLCEFIRLLIIRGEQGIFYPQNKEYVSTANLVQTIARVRGKKVYLLSCFNPLLRALAKRITMFHKLFGDMFYDQTLSNYANFEYCVNDFETSITLTEDCDE